MFDGKKNKIKSFHPWEWLAFNITSESHIKIMNIKYKVSNKSYLFFNKFSFSAPREMYREQ